MVMILLMQCCRRGRYDAVNTDVIAVDAGIDVVIVYDFFIKIPHP